MPQTFLRYWLLRSIVAILAGIFISAAPAVGTDFLLGAFDSKHPWGEAMFALATVYRVLFAIAGGYFTAWIAPSWPMGHAIVLGVLGTLAGFGGIAAYFGAEAGTMGPIWYPFAVCFIALPCAWLGAKLLRGRPTRD